MSAEKTLADVLAECVWSTCLPYSDPVGVNSRRTDGDTPLHLIAWWGDVEGARLLIEAGADVNAAGDMGGTPLHDALSARQEEVVRLLVRSGARTDIKSELGETPLEQAHRMGAEYVEWLQG